MCSKIISKQWKLLLCYGLINFYHMRLNKGYFVLTSSKFTLKTLCFIDKQYLQYIIFYSKICSTIPFSEQFLYPKILLNSFRIHYANYHHRCMTNISVLACMFLVLTELLCAQTIYSCWIWLKDVLSQVKMG